MDARHRTVAGVMLMTLAPAVGANGWRFLPAGPTGYPRVAISISYDGKTVTGSGDSPNGDLVAFLWSEEEGLRTPLPAGVTGSIGWGLSEDGGTLVGNIHAGGPAAQAFRWNAAEGFVPMCDPAQGYSTAYGVSGDGRLIVGADNNQHRGFRWSSATGYLPTGLQLALDVNRAGNAITGAPVGRWLNGVLTPIPLLPGATSGYGYGISDDGGSVCGTMTGGGIDRAFVWTASAGVVAIQDASGTPMSAASAISGDGSVVVGWGPTASGMFVWTWGRGVQDLSEVIDGPIPSGLEVPRLRDISGNGRVAVGGDVYRAFVATISVHCTADFDGDGVPGSDADIAAFFACIAGNCCLNCASADFDGDGDFATDADIEAFFRVLAGGSC